MNHKFESRLLVLAVGCAAVLPALAETQSKPLKVAESLEEVQVWGTRVSASSVYMDGEDIAIRQADHISDLLRTVPGVDVGGAHSLNQRITIRSMDDKDLRITIDGANQNTYMYHHMGNLQINADILKSVDIDVGTNSVVNGGLGGAVRFATKDADELLRGDQSVGGLVKATAGDNSGENLSTAVFGELGDVDFLAYYNRIWRDNYKVGGGVIKDANGNEVLGTNGEVKGIEGQLDNALIKLGWDISDQQRIKLGYETYRDEGDYSYRPDMGLATDLAITNALQVPLLWPTEFSRDTLTFNYDLHWGGHSQLQFSAFQNDSTLSRDESGWAENPMFAGWAAQVEGEAENTGVNLLGTTELDSHTFTYGAELIHYETDYQAVYQSGARDKSSEQATSKAVFIEDRIALGELFALTPGVRYDQYRIDSAVVDDSFRDTTGSLALEFQPTDDLLFKASQTQLFKGPEIGEVFTGAGLFDVTNANIEAESGANSELSFAWKNQHWNFGGTYFVTEIDNYIYDYATAPAETGARNWKDNIGDMQIDGFEVYAGANIGAFRGLLTFSSAESELDAFAEYPEYDGARLDRQQGDTWSLNLDYEVASANLNLHWDTLYVDDLKASPDLDGASLNNAKDGYIVHNVSASWNPLAGLNVTLGVDNLFDEFYASQSSRTGTSFHPRFGSLYLMDYEPGRNVKATVSYQF